MALIGFYGGLRITDVLSLKVGDVKGKDHIIFVESKEKKKRNIFFPKKVALEINSFIEGKPDNEPLIKSRERTKDGFDKAICREQAYRILNSAAKHLGIKEKVGTHTLRKSFGDMIAEETDIEHAQEALGHADLSSTKRYLRKFDEEIQEIINNFDLI